MLKVFFLFVKRKKQKQKTKKTPHPNGGQISLPEAEARKDLQDLHVTSLPLHLGAGQKGKFRLPREIYTPFSVTLSR